LDDKKSLSDDVDCDEDCMQIEFFDPDSPTNPSQHGPQEKSTSKQARLFTLSQFVTPLQFTEFRMDPTILMSLLDMDGDTTLSK